MKRITIDRHYIYLRDGGVCRFCGKELKFGKMSLDHYYPHSAGGPDEVFNLVCSCKTCNVMKKSRIPEDWQDFWICAFEQAVRDRKIFLSVQGMSYSALQEMAQGIVRATQEGDKSIFDNKSKRFHVKQCRITKITDINIDEINMENITKRRDYGAEDKHE